MYSELLIIVFSFIASVAANPTPIQPSRSELQEATSHPARTLDTRDANGTFDLTFEAKGQNLFSGSWAPLSGTTSSLALNCVDCRTWGQLDATVAFPEDIGGLLDDLTDLDLFNQASLLVNFTGVGASIDLGIVASLDGTVTIPLFVSESPIGVAGPGSQIGVVFFVDLILGAKGDVEADGGFQVSIPDGSSFTLPLNTSLQSVAGFDGTSIGLLPVVFNAPATITVVLQLRVQAGLQLTTPTLSAAALAGAFINIPEIILSEQFSTANSCIPVSAEIDLNAGVFVSLGADVADVTSTGFNPTDSTTFFAASTEACLDAGTAAASLPATTAAPACPTNLVTQTIITTATQTLTACAVSAVNCPANMTQVVVVHNPQTITSASCPVSVHFNTTTLRMNTAPPTGEAVTLTRLSTLVTQPITAYPTATVPARNVTTAPYYPTQTTSAAGYGNDQKHPNSSFNSNATVTTMRPVVTAAGVKLGPIGALLAVGLAFVAM